MHTLHCARNITLCDICDEPIPKREFEEHKKECPIKTQEDNDTSNSDTASANISNAQSAAPANPAPIVGSKSFRFIFGAVSRNIGTLDGLHTM